MMVDSQQDRQALLNERLRCLWPRRASLSKAEWEELYGLVFRCLRGTCWSLLGQLPGTEDDYIQDFFADKVFLNACDGREIYHSGAIIHFFRNYLRDRHRALPSGARSLDEDEDANLADADVASTWREDALIALERQDDLDQVLDLLEMAMAPGSPRADLAQAFRQHLGIDLDALMNAARCFLEARNGWESLRDQLWWIRLYLTQHFCVEDDSQVSLVELSRRHQVPSYYSRAVKLGINVPKQEDAALDAFRSSYRGQWLATLAIPVDRAHQTEMMVALKMLCLVALMQ